jgi:hypothetical protein
MVAEIRFRGEKEVPHSAHPPLRQKILLRVR